MLKKKILIICYSHHNKEPRLLMQCSALKNQFSVTTAGLSAVNDSEINFIKLEGLTNKAFFNFHQNLPAVLRAPFTLINKIQFKLTGQNFSFSNDDYKKLKSENFSLIICHHPPTLEMAFKLAKRYLCKVIFNAHEIYALEFEDDKDWLQNNYNRINGTLQKYLKQCAFVFSVNDEICKYYSKTYSCKTVSIRNSKPYHNLPVSELKEPIAIIHHGGAMPQRKLEQMADAVLQLKNRYTLTFMLVDTNSNYLIQLKEKYAPLGIKFITAVPYDKIVPEINKYDIGLYILPQEGNLNQQLALPNKLFEFIQANLAVISSPNIAMKNLVLNNKIGLVTEGFDTQSIVNTLISLSKEDILNFKKQSKSVAKELSSSIDEELILNKVQEILKLNA